MTGNWDRVSIVAGDFSYIENSRDRLTNVRGEG